jgi:translation initiation factor IF-3
MAHQELGMEMLKRIEHDLKDYATVEARPRLEGRQMVMILSPGAKRSAAAAPKVPSKEPKQPPKEKASGAS